MLRVTILMLILNWPRQWVARGSIWLIRTSLAIRRIQPLFAFFYFYLTQVAEYSLPELGIGFELIWS